jgi:hypothetical protein
MLVEITLMAEINNTLHLALEECQNILLLWFLLLSLQYYTNKY